MKKKKTKKLPIEKMLSVSEEVVLKARQDLWAEDQLVLTQVTGLESL